MTPTPVRVPCPSCQHPCGAVDYSGCDEMLRVWEARPDGGEVECPVCGWEFSVGPTGEIDDDGGLDPEPPYGVDTKGELTEEGDDDPDDIGFTIWEPDEDDEEGDGEGPPVWVLDQLRALGTFLR